VINERGRRKAPFTSTCTTKAVGEADTEAEHRAAAKGIRMSDVMFGIPEANQLTRIYKTITQDDDSTAREALVTGPDVDNRKKLFCSVVMVLRSKVLVAVPYP
jgi:hypothetical protein